MRTLCLLVCWVVVSSCSSQKNTNRCGIGPCDAGVDAARLDAYQRSDGTMDMANGDAIAGDSAADAGLDLGDDAVVALDAGDASLDAGVCTAESPTECFTPCSASADCVLARTNCCGCTSGGRRIAINKAHTAAFDAKLSCVGPSICLPVFHCETCSAGFGSAVACLSGHCAIDCP